MVKSYYPVLSEISIINRLLMRNEQFIIPSVLQKQEIEKLHNGHQGIGKCHEKARLTVWWPGLFSEREDLLANVCLVARIGHGRLN